MLALRQLLYFVVVAEEGQVTRAAARLHIAQPALSQAIAKLEAELGVQLFERHARGVTPTDAGRAFYEKAANALLAVEQAEDSLDPWLGATPRLLIGFPPDASDVARELLRRFILSHPDVELQTRHLAPAERLVELKRGWIDAELLYPPPRDPQLTERTVALSPRYVIVSDGHRLAGEVSLRFSQIEDETLPARHPSVSEELANDAWLSKYRQGPPRLASAAPTSVDELWALVSLGKAIAILPEFAVSRAQGDGVRAIPLTDVDPLAVCLAHRSDDTRPVLRDFLTTLEEVQGPAGGSDSATPSRSEIPRRQNLVAPRLCSTPNAT